MSVVLEQFVSFTSGTSLGSAKVMSTHCSIKISDEICITSLKQNTHVVQSSSMLRSLDDLDRRVLADHGSVIDG